MTLLRHFVPELSCIDDFLGIIPFRVLRVPVAGPAATLESPCRVHRTISPWLHHAPGASLAPFNEIQVIFFGEGILPTMSLPNLSPYS